MYYPETPGFQKGSDTSAEAATAAETGSKAQRNGILELLHDRALEHGVTIDEAAVYLSKRLGRDIPPGTASARMRELELKNIVKKTSLRRQTRTGSKAVVYQLLTPIPAPRLHSAGKPFIGVDMAKGEDATVEFTVNDGKFTIYNQRPATEPPAGPQKSTLESIKESEAVNGHGHVFPKADGTKKRCGGPGKCKKCTDLKKYAEAMGGA